MIILVGMVLILLVFAGVSGFSKKGSKDWENRYFHKLEQWDKPVSKNGLFEKPEYREIYYMINSIY